MCAQLKRWPFDWKTPFGYLVAWSGECAGVTAVTITVIPFFGMIFASNWLFIVIVEDMTGDVTTFNNIIKMRKDKDIASDHVELVERFSNIVQHNTDTKQ